MAVVHAFDPPERFVVGTVGEPGDRTFFLQARVGSQLVSVALEKQQVAVLAERVDELLDEVMRSASSVVPAVAPYGLDDNAPLDQPIQEEFRVGTMTLSWDPDDERVVIEVFPVGEATDDEEEDEEAEPEEMLLVRLEPGHARSFVKRAALVVDAGRPACPFCGSPIDPSGHLCVRANGFKRRITSEG
jgi:uncharacterized repeat protein (TIGR03847 family)